MQSLMFLACFVEKSSKKNLWGFGSTPFGKGRVNELRLFQSNHKTSNITNYENVEMAK